MDDGKGKLGTSAMPLDFVQLNQSHTGKYLARMVQFVVKKFGLENRICGIVSDNASNNATMIRESAKLYWKRFEGEPHWIRCFAHILNLIVKAILRPFGRAKKASGSGEIEESDGEEAAEELVDTFQTGQATADSDSDDGGDEDEDKAGGE
ncbi:hypothetical protein Pst134EB_012644 [Puccinia striiformis f. sp. tritici]|nr:hypothetical protein Pst134EB_012644 [Puccinia striiformis f. sp. tritici]